MKETFDFKSNFKFNYWKRILKENHSKKCHSFHLTRMFVVSTKERWKICEVVAVDMSWIRRILLFILRIVSLLCFCYCFYHLLLSNFAKKRINSPYALFLFSKFVFIFASIQRKKKEYLLSLCSFFFEKKKKKIVGFQLILNC